MSIFFLPGVGGSAAFWRPVAAKLTTVEPKYFFSWPGLGNEPSNPLVQSIDDLVGMVIEQITQPSSLVAQSMGGYVALRVALERPDLVRRLVLTVASAGLAMNELGAINWRNNYAKNFPAAANWISEPTEDLSAKLSKITVPCLLIWGSADLISPVAVGEKLRTILPNAYLHVFDNADHDLAISHAGDVAKLIDKHLAEV